MLVHLLFSICMMKLTRNSPLLLHAPFLKMNWKFCVNSWLTLTTLKKTKFHLKVDIIFQGWTSLFAEFVGPVYPDLVKEFWAHAVVAPISILSFVHGKFVVITENILRVMFDLKNPEGAFEFDQRAYLGDVLSTLYPNVKKTKNLKEFENVFQILEKILLWCLLHRKGTHASD